MGEVACPRPRTERYIPPMKRLLTPLMAGALALSLAACGSDSADDKADGALIKAGEIKVCSELPYRPFEFKDDSAPSGYSGFDIDVVQAIADELDIKVVVSPQDFSPIQSGAVLNARTCDLGASAITIGEERAKKIDFSDPYFDSVQSLLVPADSGVKSLDDLKGKRIGVQKSTTGADYARENSEGKIVDYADDSKLFQALKAGAIDAILQDFGPNAEHAEDPKYTMAAKYETSEQYGFAIRKGNTELLEDVNGALKTIRDNGTYDEIHAKYFG
jgi:polar amino acid transport system substrate-binding protein